MKSSLSKWFLDWLRTNKVVSSSLKSQSNSVPFWPFKIKLNQLKLNQGVNSKFLLWVLKCKTKWNVILKVTNWRFTTNSAIINMLPIIKFNIKQKLQDNKRWLNLPNMMFAWITFDMVVLEIRIIENMFDFYFRSFAFMIFVFLWTFNIVKVEVIDLFILI